MPHEHGLDMDKIAGTSIKKHNSPSFLGLFLTRRYLHRLESLVHRDLAATQNWAAPGLLDCLAQRVSLDN